MKEAPHGAREGGREPHDQHRRVTRPRAGRHPRTLARQRGRLQPHPHPTVYATDEELRFIARCRDLPAHIEHEATNDAANMSLIATMRNALPGLLRELE